MFCPINLNPTNQDFVLKLFSWNINGVSDKLNNNYVFNLVSHYDILFISEIKTNFSIHVPGFKSFINFDSENPNRGGIALFIKNYLVNFISSIDMSNKETIWLELSSHPHVCIGGLYLTPDTSHYSDQNVLPMVQSKILSSNATDFLLLGDFNARYGINSLSKMNNIANKLLIGSFYENMADQVLRPNSNGRKMLNFMEHCNILSINGLTYPDKNKHFNSKLTFKRSLNWLSEIDFVYSSPNLIKYISNFQIHDNHQLPSNHAPISVDLCIPNSDRIMYVDIMEILKHVNNYDHLDSSRFNHIKKFASNNINSISFHDFLNEHSPQLAYGIDIDSFNLEDHIDLLYSSVYNACDTSCKQMALSPSY